MTTNEKTLDDYTRKELEALPERKYGEDIGKFDSLVILPLRQLHDSGYRVMDFVAVLENKPICRLSGCSDVIHIDGIGGYGYRWSERENKIPDKIKPSGWSIDCLPKSGLLRLFPTREKRPSMIAGEALSSFEVYCDE